MDKHELLQSLNGEAPTPDQAAMLMDMAMGDTDFFAESGSGAPAAEAGAGEAMQPEGADAVTTDDGSQEAAGDGNTDSSGTSDDQAADDLEGLSEANAVVVAKDGKHHIPFERLAESRSKAQAEAQARAEAEARADAAEAALEELRAQQQERAESGKAPTVADSNLATAEAAIEAGVDPEIFGDFSEEALAKGVITLTRQEAQRIAQEEVKAQVAEALRPYQEQQQAEADSSHMAAIRAAHPDLDSILESAELEAWKDAQPSYVKQGIVHVMLNGSTQEVIELLDTYKASTGVANKPALAKVDAEEAKAAAKQALDKAKPAPPVSLSDIPGGRPATGGKFEVLAQMGGADLADALSDMPSDQIEAFLNRSM